MEEKFKITDFRAGAPSMPSKNYYWAFYAKKEGDAKLEEIMRESAKQAVKESGTKINRYFIRTYGIDEKNGYAAFVLYADQKLNRYDADRRCHQDLLVMRVGNVFADGTNIEGRCIDRHTEDIHQGGDYYRIPVGPEYTNLKFEDNKLKYEKVLEGYVSAYGEDEVYRSKKKEIPLEEIFPGLSKKGDKK